jgi:hypothetical protein
MHAFDVMKKLATPFLRSATWLLMPEKRVERFSGGTLIELGRQRRRSGSWCVDRRVKMGKNHFHAWVSHPDGSIDDCGVSNNLLTYVGECWWAQTWGAIPTAQNGPATATTTTSVTGTGTTWTASNLATPVLGLAGMRVYMPVTGLTTAPVYGNIVSNTTSVATIDQWWNAADGTGTQPANTSALIIAPGGVSAARFVALTQNASAASHSDTALASEITTGGCARAKSTYAFTPSGSAFDNVVLTNSFSITSTFAAIQKGGLFSTVAPAGADPLLYETVFNAVASVVSGDTLNLTWTLSPSG